LMQYLRCKTLATINGSGLKYLISDIGVIF